MKRLGIELLTVFGMPPVEQVSLAADLGCGHISIGLEPVPWKADFFPNWSLRDDSRLRSSLKTALRERDVAISLGEGFAVRQKVDVHSYAGDLDILADLGARAINSVCMEPDPDRAIDQFAGLADLVKERGMNFNIEFAPPHPINTLEKALTLIGRLGNDKARLVIDAMHFFRSGGTIATLASLAPQNIGYVQLCDVPFSPPHDDYLEEACFARKIPGDGDLPLAEFVALIPPSVSIGLEIPMQCETQSHQKLKHAIARSVLAGKQLLE